MGRSATRPSQLGRAFYCYDFANRQPLIWILLVEPDAQCLQWEYQGGQDDSRQRQRRPEDLHRSYARPCSRCSPSANTTRRRTHRRMQSWVTSFFRNGSATDRKRGTTAKLLLKVLVGERGFEPPTPWSRTRCSTRLSHSPTKSSAVPVSANNGLSVLGAQSPISDYSIGDLRPMADELLPGPSTGRPSSWACGLSHRTNSGSVRPRLRCGIFSSAPLPR